MKTIRILVSAAFMASSIAPGMTGVALAAAPSSYDMEGACAALVNAGEITPHTGEVVWDVTATPTSSVAGPTTEVPGTREVISGSQFGTGSPTYSDFYISDEPYRVGGSVNMFGNQYARVKNWPSSEYDYTADYSTTTTYSFDCSFRETVEIYHPPVIIPGHPVEGYYENNGTNPSDGGGSCQGISPSHPKWGEDIGNCTFIETGPAVEDVNEPEYWTSEVVDRFSLNQTLSLDGVEVESQTGHESNGPAIYESGEFYVDQAVVCISPGRNGGAWRTQNGYGGSNCSTTYFNTAPRGPGSTTSHGTYISVPAI